MYYIDYICFMKKYNETSSLIQRNKIVSIGLDIIHLAIDIHIFL